MKSVALFCAVSILHFTLSVAGVVLGLPAAFDAQGGFWAAPVKISLVWISTVLLAPLTLVGAKDFGYLEIAAVSVLFGLAAVGLLHLATRYNGLPRTKR